MEIGSELLRSFGLGLSVLIHLELDFSFYPIFLRALHSTRVTMGQRTQAL